MKFAHVGLLMAIGLVTPGCSANRRFVSLERARVVTYASADGMRLQMIYIDWFNDGDLSVDNLQVDVKLYDTNNVLVYSAVGVVIYSSDEGSEVRPGKYYVEPHGRGILVPLRKGQLAGKRVEVENFVA